MLWIEIEFTDDIERARAEVLPRILSAGGTRRAAMMIIGDMTRAPALGL